MTNHPNRTKRAVERRAEKLATQLKLSLQLTITWIEQNPKKARYPMTAEAMSELYKWAKL